MISIISAIAIAVGTLMIITVIVTLMTGSVFAAGVVVALIVLGVVVLKYYGILTVEVSGNQVEVFLKDIWAKATASPAAPKQTTYRPIQGKEVYHVGDDRFTYEEAPAVCAAYGGELATQDQVEEAHSQGAEWCAYGWSAGGMALYPTQKSTWDALQKETDPKKRTACGRPGVNGGYFDPTLKFGVNCYGVKPKGSVSLPLPLPGQNPKAFNEMVARFKKQMSDFFLSPFNRGTWAYRHDYGEYGTQFQQQLGQLIPGEETLAEQEGRVGPQYTFQAMEKKGPAAPGASPASTASPTPGPAPAGSPRERIEQAALAQAQSDPRQAMQLAAMRARMASQQNTAR